MVIGTKIKEARQEMDISQLELAERVGVEQATVSRWERDERSPSYADLARIASACNKPLHYFFGEERVA